MTVVRTNRPYQPKQEYIHSTPSGPGTFATALRAAVANDTREFVYDFVQIERLTATDGHVIIYSGSTVVYETSLTAEFPAVMLVVADQFRGKASEAQTINLSSNMSLDVVIKGHLETAKP